MQQILLIVLSVIIVGAAVAVGITMFSTQAINSNRSAVLSDMNTFAASALAYFKTPTNLAGAGSDFSWTVNDIAEYIGVGHTGTDAYLETGNAYYTVATCATPGVVFRSSSKEAGVNSGGAAGVEDGVDGPSLAIDCLTGAISVETDGTAASL